jgi:predicted dehydrogenase
MPDANFSRRRLLYAGSMVPAAAVRSSAANSAVSVGLIGAGGRGTLDATLLVKNTPARLAALCDIVPERMERATKATGADHPRLYADYRELLASDVDAVIIATPVFLHPEHLEAAIRAGKHIYIEKPAGADIEGCKRVMRAADSADRRLNISFGFQQRYGPGYLKARALVASGQLGPIRFAHAHFIKGEGKPDPNRAPKPSSDAEKLRTWKLWRETFGDYIVETYCHSIDVLNWFLGGHPDRATAAGSQTLLRQGEHHDHTAVAYTYEGGRQAQLTGCQIAPRFHRDVNERFYFELGVIETAREYWKHATSTRDVKEEREPRDITIDALAGFVERVRTGKPENMGTSAAESTLTAILGRMAMDLKREVTWKEMMA